jgi:hypothetical protein
MKYMGDYADDSTVRIFFTTNDGSGGAVAPSTAFEAADIVIYKNNSATQKATSNGITMTSPFDSVTGLHLVEIDCSNDTGDAGFWATGNDYSVILSPDETVDSQTVVAAIAQFSIENRVVSAVSGNVAGIAGTITTLDGLNNFDPTSDTVANVTTVGSVTGAVGSVTAAVTTDSASRTASQADVSALATSSALATAQADLDTLTGTDGVTLATSQPNYAPNTTTPPTAAAVADAVWDEAYSGHTTAGTFGKLMDIIRKANLSIDGTVSGTPTSSAFDTNLTDADGAHDHQLLLFVSGSLTGYSSPIDSYVQSSGRITLQEALTAAPSASDEFVILPQHVHPIDEIQSGLATASALSTVSSKVDTIDGVVDAILLDTGTDGVVLSTATLQNIADEILKRDVDNVEATANEHTLATIILAILESSRSSTTWTIKRTDGSTTHATKTLTLDATANPVTGVT